MQFKAAAHQFAQCGVSIDRCAAFRCVAVNVRIGETDAHFAQTPSCDPQTVAAPAATASATDPACPVEIGQIGRASCRERVCSTFRSSLSPVLLKKKKTQLK